MKRIFFISGLLLPAFTVIAQEPSDALRYSWIIQSGTARHQAIGGSMGSLGGDISAIYVNPAGLGFYRTGDVVMTPGYRFNNNESLYYGEATDARRNRFSYGASGVAYGEGDRRRSGAVALAINRTASFGNHILYRGANTENSYSQRFLEEIQGVKDPNVVANDFPFGTSLAFNTYWIDTVAGGSPGNYQFQSRSPLANGLLQEQEIITSGGITEIALGFAGSREDKWFFGGSVGVPIVSFSRQAVFTEADASTDPNNNFDFASIEENLRTIGGGVNFRAGMIYKPKEFVRLGLALHSPTFLMLTDKYDAVVTTDTENYQGLLTQYSSDITGVPQAEFRYWTITPYRVIASASYVLRETQDVKKQKGFITADIEYVNHRASSFTTDPEWDDSQETRDYLKSVNRAINRTYKGAFNFRAGGELKFTTLMARLGAAYYGNPYKDINGERGHRFQVTGGLGYRHKGFFVDLAYVHTTGRDVHFAYRLSSQSYRGAQIRSTDGNVLLTVGIKI